MILKWKGRYRWLWRDLLLRGDIALEIFFSTVVGTGSRSQYESDDSESRLSISSKVAGVKEWRRGGAEGGRE